MQTITPAQLAEQLAHDNDFLLLDVREPWEFSTAAIAGSINIPMNSIPANLSELDQDKTTVVICHHGMRSAQVAMFLLHQGFVKVINLTGGIDRWSTEVDEQVPRY